MDRRDFVAGLSVAGLLLPEAVAYATIAGLPPQRAIFAAIAGTAVYALVGRSRLAIVSPTSSSAAILAAALGTLAAPDAAKAMLATLAVALVASTFLLAGVLKLGSLTSFVSRPVLRGFAFGLAVTIIIKQLPSLLGVEGLDGGIPQTLHGLWLQSGQWNWTSLATGIGALGLLLALRRLPKIPGALLVIGCGILLSFALDLVGHGVAVVGAIDLRLASPSWPALDMMLLSQLAELVLPLFLILLAESWGTMRSLALHRGDNIDADRELRALGWSNLAAATVQGMPVGAGFSAGSANEAAGAQSRFAGAVAAFGLTVLLLAGSAAIAHLPKPVLAAVVIAALTNALDPAPFRHLLELKRDFMVAIGAALAVLLLGVLDGMLVAILLSLLLLVQRLSSPAIVRLGRIGPHDFVDADRHSEARVPANVSVWRPAEPLFFGNAERIFAAVEERSKGEAPKTALVLSLEGSVDLDSSALDALIEFERRLARDGTILFLARVHDPVRDLLLRAGAQDLVERSSYSVDDAVAAAERRDSTHD
ncbi:MAG: SulP family inorganic anion transporter [Sphingomonadales bacterium]|nr:SulP family inorganic anion transporter [Sphingomonadales bacterium]